jgi:hypothetical protein
MQGTQSKTAKSVAAILEKELDPMISEWKRQASLVPSLTAILLSDSDRTGHLHKLSTRCFAACEVTRIPNRWFLSPQPRTEDYDSLRATL